MELKIKNEGFYTETEFGVLHISGNEQYGFPPYKLMVASIAACSGSVLRQILSKRRLKVDDLKVTTEVYRNKAEKNQIEKIHIHYLIKGTNLDVKKINKSIELASKHCPMVQSVKDSIIIEETFELV